jgi:hypothetical protein
MWSAARLLPLFCAHFHAKVRLLTNGRFKTAAASVPHSTWVQDMRINHGRSHIVAPQEFLDVSNVTTACKEMGGKGTPPRVASGDFCDYHPPDHEVLFPRAHATFHQAQLPPLGLAIGHHLPLVVSIARTAGACQAQLHREESDGACPNSNSTASDGLALATPDCRGRKWYRERHSTTDAHGFTRIVLSK